MITKLPEFLKSLFDDADTSGFNEYDYLHAFGSGAEALLYFRLFWPEFVEINDMLFVMGIVEDEVDCERILKFYKENGNDKKKTEMAFNLVDIPALFGKRVGETSIGGYEFLASLMKETWKAKSIQQYPQRNVVFEITRGKEPEEINLVFYQVWLK